MLRLGREEQRDLTVQVATARFGIPRLKQELRAFDRALKAGSGRPDVLLVVIDGNSAGSAARKREVSEAIDVSNYPAVIVATPEPCIERWYLADPEAFLDRFGVQPPVSSPSDSCDELKRRLISTLGEAGETVLTGGSEFADDIVDAMDFYRAGRREPALKRFLDETRAVLKRLPAES